MEGDQHLSTTKRHWEAKHVTAVFLLQNDKGAEKWPLAQTEALRQAFRDSKGAFE